MVELDTLQERRMFAHSGLSITVAGRLIYLERNEQSRVAKIVVEPTDDGYGELTRTEESAVSTAAAILVRRGRRVLGGSWKIYGYMPDLALTA